MSEQPIYLLGERLKLYQPTDGFKTGLDAVILAAACPAKAGQSVLDLGCGVGSAGFCVLARVPDTRLIGLEIQQNHVDLAVQNAALNDMSDRAAFICADIRDYRTDDKADHVICNPPYLEEGAHLRSPSAERATAMGHGEEGTTLTDWLDGAARCLKPNGTLTLIHRADMIDKILQAMGTRFGAVEIIPLWPRAGVEAKRVIIRAMKGRKTPACIHAGLILHEPDGSYTKEAEQILRDGNSISSLRA